MDFKIYREKQNELFNNKWIDYPEDENKKFTWDGIVAENDDDYEKWLNSKSKVLYLVKEAHGDYEPSIPTEVERKFNLNLARWKYLIEFYVSNGIVPSFPNDEILRGKNSGIAIVEVKKYDEGKKTSSDDEILHYAKRDADFLREQIELINPNIIICCGTFNAYFEGIYSSSNDDIVHQYYANWLEDENIHASIYSHKNKTILNFYHPSYSKSPKTLYDLLGELFLKQAELSKGK